MNYLTQPWSAEEIDFANYVLHNGGYPSDVSFRVSKKFLISRSTDDVKAAIKDGTLSGDISGRIAVYGKINRKQAHNDWIEPRAYVVEKRWREDKQDHDVDQLLDIGVTLLDLQANQCRYPVARWPKDFPEQRFCGAHRAMNGKFFASSYCEMHRELCTKKIPVAEAAE